MAKVIIDIMTKHAYLPTTLITDKGTAFTSKLVAEVGQILGMKCATTNQPQTIGKLERTHASLKTNLKMASGDYRQQWHKYLPLAVLNYNTTYHVTLGCEPSRRFHGRIPYNNLDHKLGPNPNPKVLPTTDFADEFQRRTRILLDSTNKNIMQSYLKYKEYYDRKAKAAPLKPNDYCFILQPIADHQGSKIPFREYRWTGPYIVEKVLPNENYIVRKLNSNKTQILHRIRQRKNNRIPPYRKSDRKATCNRTMTLLFRKMTCTSSRGKLILENFPIQPKKSQFLSVSIPQKLLMILWTTPAHQTKFSLMWTFGPPGHTKTAIPNRFQKHSQTARMTGLMINNHQEGAILSCPKYQMMKMI